MDKTNFTTTCHFLSLCTRQRDHHFQIVFTWTIDKHRVPFGFIFAKSLSVSFVDKRARHHHPGFGLLVSLINAEPASVSLHKAPFGASSLCAPTIHAPLIHTDKPLNLNNQKGQAIQGGRRNPGCQTSDLAHNIPGSISSLARQPARAPYTISTSYSLACLVQVTDNQQHHHHHPCLSFS